MYFVRRANIEDFIDIANIHFESWCAAYLGLLPESYISSKNNLFEKTEMWQELIVHPDVLVWVAYDTNQKTLGFIGYFKNNDNYEITTLYVLPDYQGTGIGTALAKTSLQKILESNINAQFCLWVLESNAAAIDFYKKFDFVLTGDKSEECYEGSQIIDIKMIRETNDLIP